jgi:hypothetical protein
MSFPTAHVPSPKVFPDSVDGLLDDGICLVDYAAEASSDAYRSPVRFSFDSSEAEALVRQFARPWCGDSTHTQVYELAYERRLSMAARRAADLFDYVSMFSTASLLREFR